jgi:flagellar basal-body rod modification protein FlgD
MTSPISGSSDVGAKIAAMATAGTPAPQATSTESKSKTEMDKDMFLKLLVAQLKYQDPTKPADTTQFLAQTAQFTVVEKLSELSKQQTEMVTAQLMNSATNLIGRTVTYTDEKGDPHTGVVAATTIGSNPMLKIGNTDVALSQVKEVRPTTNP